MEADFTSMDGQVSMMDEVMGLMTELETSCTVLSPAIESLVQQMMQMKALALSTDAALKSGDPEAAAGLLDNIKGITGMDYADDPPLGDAAQKVFDAIQDGDVAALKTALVGFDVNAGHGTYGSTPLYAALSDFEPSRDVIQTLLAHGADPALGLIGDSNVLHGAAFGSYDDWDQQDVNDIVASCCAARGGLLEVRTPKLGWTPLHTALMESNAELAIACLVNGADPNAHFGTTNPPTYGSGDTPLHAILYQPDLVAILLDHGADPTQTNAAGQTVIEACAAELSEARESDFAAKVQASLDLITARKSPH